MEYIACTDKACAWDASGSKGDVDRAYKAHRKHHPQTKAQIAADPRPPAPELEADAEPAKSSK